ncbi:non-specific lipid-transfer protein-like protein [Artemisia annua]|uniref:Non-specific lipid-transfer protein-like protein n=1 Tax=Artemisia annua TaxID=35608 RepID=A0A2U1QD21_ARTAN|nr:non-specific lipid-transfer protein-like protein [Artemisia annua]
MSNFTQTLCFLFALTLVSLLSSAAASRPHPPSKASAPQKPSCDSLKFKMNDCIPYLKKDSSMAKPVTSCCSGVKDVWKVDSTCVYEALKINVELGFNINVTRVARVSSACGFMDVSLD